jgi:RNA polymerase sigma factor (sigma-70 family)
MSDYRLQIKVKNNRILDQIEKCGYSSVGEFCRLNDLQATLVGKYVNLQKTPLNAKGIFRSEVEKIALCLGCCCEDLFSEKQLETELESNTYIKKVSEAEVMLCLEKLQQPGAEEIVYQKQMQEQIGGIIAKLSPRQADIISMRYGFNGYAPHTYSEIGEKYEVTPNRIRDIEHKILRYLRHPGKSAGKILAAYKPEYPVCRDKDEDPWDSCENWA